MGRGTGNGGHRLPTATARKQGSPRHQTPLWEGAFLINPIKISLYMLSESTLFERAHILHWRCCENTEIIQHRLTYQSISLGLILFKINFPYVQWILKVEKEFWSPVPTLVNFCSFSHHYHPQEDFSFLHKAHMIITPVTKNDHTSNRKAKYLVTGWATLQERHCCSLEDKVGKTWNC